MWVLAITYLLALVAVVATALGRWLGPGALGIRLCRLRCADPLVGPEGPVLVSCEHEATED